MRVSDIHAARVAAEASGGDLQATWDAALAVDAQEGGGTCSRFCHAQLGPCQDHEALDSFCCCCYDCCAVLALVVLLLLLVLQAQPNNGARSIRTRMATLSLYESRLCLRRTLCSSRALDRSTSLICLNTQRLGC